MIQFPPYLKKGATIGITCPAGYMAADRAAICIETLQQWGFDVMVGKTLGSNSTNYFSGTDEQRLNELQAMLDNDDIDAILFGRGGYGVGRIIDRIDFTRFKKKPKWLIGYSDITILHAHISRSYNIASIHSPMAGAFNVDAANNHYVQAIYKAITGKKANYTCLAHPYNKPGNVTAELVGGNLTLLAHLVGTKSSFITKNKILFIEDIGELLYNVDRMLYQLKRSGMLDNLAALIVGGFTEMRDTERPFGQTVEDIIKAIADEYDYPVCFHFPVSHEKENYPLKVGGSYELKITKTKVTLKEQ